MDYTNIERTRGGIFQRTLITVSLLCLLILGAPWPLFSENNCPPYTDFNGDGVVDFADFLLFVNTFGSRQGQDGYAPKYDLDQNGEIGFGDFLIFADSFGKAVTPVANGGDNCHTPRANNPVLVEDHFVETTRGQPDGVDVSVVDGEGFESGEHGQRITDIFLLNSDRARLVQRGGSGVYRLDGLTLRGKNATGYIRHVLENDEGIFWTATDQSPAYKSETMSAWFLEDNRPFTLASRAFATWMRDRNTLFVTALENPTTANGVPVYCDDFDRDVEWWIPPCGDLGDYIAHSGTGLDNVVFVGAIDVRFSDRATGAIRADGVYAPHTIYVESPNGTTSQAAPVLAAYATNLAYKNPTWGAAKLKQELVKLSRDETIRYFVGAITDQGAIVTETRTIKVIRPAFAPDSN